MSGHVRVGGAWKTVAGVSTRVGGAWKTVTDGWTKVGGVWKQWFTSAPAGSYELISSTILASAQTTFTFSSIPQGYKHLEIRVTAKSSSTGGGLALRWNGISSGYFTHFLRAGDSVTSGGSTSQSLVRLGPISWPQNEYFMPYVVQILDYSQTGKNKTLRSLGGQQNWSLDFISGSLANTSAITSVSLFSETFNLASGSRFSLYGIRG